MSETSQRSPMGSWLPRRCSPRLSSISSPISREVSTSTPALAAAAGIAENRLTTLLSALKSLGLISEERGCFMNAPGTARYLVAGAPGDFRDYVQFVNGEFGYESFRHLGAALRGERIFPDKGFTKG